VQRLLALRRRAGTNAGRWTPDQQRTVSRCAASGEHGRIAAKAIQRLAMTRGLKMPDGQSAHARYVRIARRANPPQPDGVAGYPKSVAFRIVPRSIRGALRDRQER
jgi:hypothetical protein